MKNRMNNESLEYLRLFLVCSKKPSCYQSNVNLFSLRIRPSKSRQTIRFWFFSRTTTRRSSPSFLSPITIDLGVCPFEKITNMLIKSKRLERRAEIRVGRISPLLPRVHILRSSPIFVIVGLVDFMHSIDPKHP